MGRSLPSALALAVLIAVSANAPDSAANSLTTSPNGHFSSAEEGVSIRYPAGWRLTTHNNSYVPDPALCFDLDPFSNPKIDVRMVEYLPPYFNPRDPPERISHDHDATDDRVDPRLVEDHTTRSLPTNLRGREHRHSRPDATLLELTAGLQETSSTGRVVSEPAAG